jgi:N-acetylglutamate synthase-like GNAT family acetyltransferase
MRTRNAILPDAQQIHDLISAYSGDGTLLPRTPAEICENVRDFVVLEEVKLRWCEENCPSLRSCPSQQVGW